MDIINFASLQIINWLGIYFLHSTVLFIMAIGARKIVQSLKIKELMLRFALFGPILTSTVQVATGWGFKVSGLESFTQPDYLAVHGTSAPSLMSPFWPTACIGLWIVVSAFLVIRHLNAYRSLMQFVCAKDYHHHQFYEWAGRNSDLFEHSGKIEFWFSSQTISPFVHAGNKILVPELAFEKLNDQELRSTIAHELAHIARADWYWLQAYCLIRFVFFFQPLNKLTCHALIKNTETICDAQALRVTNDQKSLAKSILEIASWRHMKVALVSGMAFHSSFLSERINAIACGKPLSNHSNWLAWLMFVPVSAICIFSTPTFSAPLQVAESVNPKAAPVSDASSLPRQDEPYEIDVNVPVETEVDPYSIEVNIELNIEKEIELNPLK